MEKQGISSMKTPNKTYNWSTGWSHGDSPGNGDVPFSQEIIWDSTSPNARPRNNSVIEISDIVSRIAPKNGKPLGSKSPWRELVGDSAMMCTPENPQNRVRARSIRQSNDDDLMKLARQFDDNLREQGETSLRTNVTEMPPQSGEGVQEVAVQDAFRTLWEQTESEFQAMFDSSTQRVSGRLSSQGSYVATHSQEKERCPEAQGTSSANGAPPQQTKPIPAGSSSQQLECAAGANPTTDERSSLDVVVAECDNVDDDWEDDKLFLDCLEQVMTQHYEPPRSTMNPTSSVRPSTSQQPSDSKPRTNGSSACQASHLPPQSTGRSLQEQCPKPKTSNRRTFKLDTNPHFQASSATSDLKKDTMWDDLDDDLLYEVCETVEKNSSAQPERRSDKSESKQGNTKDCQQDVTTPLAINTTKSINGTTNVVKRQLSCSFVRSNSLPVSTNYQGWNIPFKGAEAAQSVMSQSHPGTSEGLGTFSHLKDSSRTFQASVAVQPHTVTARSTPNPAHSSFKRSLSDTGFVSNKVHVTNQATAKCSAAEIERKRREALARRRQRMETSQKR